MGDRHCVQPIEEDGFGAGRLLVSVEAFNLTPDELYAHFSPAHQLKVEGQRVNGDGDGRCCALLPLQCALYPIVILTASVSI